MYTIKNIYTYLSIYMDIFIVEYFCPYIDWKNRTGIVNTEQAELWVWLILFDWIFFHDTYCGKMKKKRYSSEKKLLCQSIVAAMAYWQKVYMMYIILCIQRFCIDWKELSRGVKKKSYTLVASVYIYANEGKVAKIYKDLMYWHIHFWWRNLFVI